jgi:hypothetical protein
LARSGVVFSGPPGDADDHAVGFAPVVHSGLDVQVATWLVPSVSADLVTNAVVPVEGAGSKIQAVELVLRPALSFPLRRRLLLSAHLAAPIARSLGGSTFSGGLLVTTSL